MPAIAFAAPLLPGKTHVDREEMKACWDGPRKAEHDAARARLGITKMAIWIQPTPGGDVAVVHLEADDLEAAGRGMATSEDPFDRWFADHVRDVHGIAVEDGLPPAEQILDYAG